MTAKNAALEKLQLRIVNVGRQMEAQCRLVGLDDVADRLRLAVRARRNSEGDAPAAVSTPTGGAPAS